LADGRLPSEEMGCLRGYEMICCTRVGDSIRAVAGYGNGGRRPDGSVL